MRKFLTGILIWIMLITPIFSGLNEHTYPIFNDWIYDGYNNEGDWVAFDLGTLDGSLDNKQSLVRISIEVVAFTGDDSESIYLYLKEHDGGYKTERMVWTSYESGLKGELECWTDGEGWIDYKLEYPQPEAKKIQIMMRIVNSIN